MVVAAGVENDQAEPAALSTPGMKLRRPIASCSTSGRYFSSRIDWDQPVLAADLDAVAGEVHDGDVGAVGLLVEVP